MKKIPLLVLLGLLMGSYQMSLAQVFGHPGATWVFHSSPFLSMCSQSYESWEYTGDTILMGENAKILSVTRKQSFYWDTTQYFPVSHYTRYFKVNSDTVSMLNPADTTWVEIYNFSVGIGDSITSPINNTLNWYSTSCSDSLAYNSKAVVIDTGTVFLYGQNLRYYTVQYIYDDDSSEASITFYERLMTYSYWIPDPLYICNTTDWCSQPVLFCYKDNDMITDSLCTDVSWIETLSISEQPQLAPGISIYPNPVHEVLVIQANLVEPQQYQIISADGKLVMINIQSPINVSNLQSGVYFITNKSRSWYKKFIKQ